jgi:6-phosphofructo-2-kinase/fructose-2,6-biphosphatase 2
VAVEALNDMKAWFDDATPFHPAVAIYDATNSTMERRQLIYEFCKEHDIQVLFIESVCHSEDVVLQNIKQVKLTSPDYANKDPDDAAADFKARIAHYEKAYETVGLDKSEHFYSYVKMIDLGAQFVLHMIQNYLQSRIVFYLMNLHIRPRSIFISRHGMFRSTLLIKVNQC